MMHTRAIDSRLLRASRLRAWLGSVALAMLLGLASCASPEPPVPSLPSDDVAPTAEATSIVEAEAPPTEVAETATSAPVDTSTTAFGRARMYPSVWPHARSDTWRTGSAVGAGLPAGFAPDALVARSVELPRVPLWAVVRDEDAVYVQGGTPMLLEAFSFATVDDAGSGELGAMAKAAFALDAAKSEVVGAFIARVEPASMSVTGIARFPRGGTLNYTSSLVLHENGRLYTIANATLYEVDPDSMEITRSLALPTYDTSTAGTVYNSIVIASATGDLVTKSTNIMDGSLPAQLLSIDVSDLSIRHQAASSIGATRLGLVTQGGVDYIYGTDETQTIRYALDESGFAADEAWSTTYRDPSDGSTAAVSMAYMGEQERVVFPNNNTVIYGVDAPLQLFSQSTADTEGALFSTNATSETGPGGSFYSSAVDPHNTHMVVANDQINRRLAGWRVEDDGTMTKLWETDAIRSSAGTAIGSDQQHLYVDDLRCDESGEDCETYLVVLDMRTGDRLAEVAVAGTAPSLGQIFLSRDEVYYIASEVGGAQGYLTQVGVR